ncbi:hypothetical protein KBT16_29160 [Nostoc sp. CCCryo 231-06]|nr:hypothetical protein [Nostoc sp. CCCryo 231-06]
MYPKEIRGNGKISVKLVNDYLVKYRRLSSGKLVPQGRSQKLTLSKVEVSKVTHALILGFLAVMKW